MLTPKGNLLLVRGVPGRGKSTLGELLATLAGARHLEADQFFSISGQYRFDPAKLHAAHGWCREECYLAMLKEYPLIVVTNTFTRNREMAPYISDAKAMNYRYTVVTVESGHPACGLAGRNIHGVPEETITAMLKRWEQFSD